MPSNVEPVLRWMISEVRSVRPTSVDFLAKNSDWNDLTMARLAGPRPEDLTTLRDRL